MSSRSDAVYLLDMLDSINAIEQFVVSFDNDTFVRDRKTYSATLRELEVIGEAGGKISDDLKSRHPEIDWRTLKDFRNVLAHEYFGVNSEIVWDVVVNKLPVLKGLLAAVVREEEKG
jgi:uncharacterized protein with HEPN domain